MGVRVPPEAPPFGSLRDLAAKRASLRAARRRLRAAARLGLRLALGAVGLCVLWVGLYAAVPPPTTALIEIERARLGSVSRNWRPLAEISPHLARAVVAAEDARFCQHNGFDRAAIEAAWRSRMEGGALRGGSTISQQTAKNAFLWPERSWSRKALEAGFTALIELLWSKRRILEVYLNIAEFGPGVFGAEAAAQRWFGKPASALTAAESARLATLLPAPRSRDPNALSPALQRRARAIADGAATLRATGADACVFD
ncbi:MAG: monofunctional biosynthetic peptidoglycan transglycosylase [Rubrimonas sp.]|uniref:monofunctional biosynthetic peptidoglycan transglycosylase n=1 Tax=Rubrimonas sp. TaxID=2036015 RepID=UPI003DD11BB6